MRKLIFAAALAIVAWAALVVPVPFAALAPVPAQPVSDVVELAGGTPEPLPGDLLFTAVQLRQPSTVGAVGILFDDDRSLSFLPTLVPADIEPEEFARLQRRQFRESIRAAAAVGLRAADREVTVSGDGARVVRTLPGTPAADELMQEDVITAADGEDITLASDLASLLAEKEAGDEVELTIRREDRTVTETVALTQLSQLGQPGIGVLVSTVNLEIELPVEVEAAADAAVGGPSAGLMIALAVYDAATSGDLTGGRVVAGTGTISLRGEVGPVSGVPEKVSGAVVAAADVFLVPEESLAAAREAAPATLEVVPVGTLEDAIGALSG